jgi:hypothetical protein
MCNVRRPQDVLDSPHLVSLRAEPTSAASLRLALMRALLGPFLRVLALGVLAHLAHLSLALSGPDDVPLPAPAPNGTLPRCAALTALARVDPPAALVATVRALHTFTAARGVTTRSVRLHQCISATAWLASAACSHCAIHQCFHSHWLLVQQACAAVPRTRKRTVRTALVKPCVDADHEQLLSA